MNLLPYQVASFERLVAAVRTHGAALDASDTGVGKTHVACAACKELGLRPRDGGAERGLRPAVVCPKNLIPVWRKACRDWGLPEPLFVLNYEVLRTGRTPFLTWDSVGRTKVARWHLPPGTVLVFDEAHRCAGDDSLNSKMLAAVRRYGIPTICLSATAAESPLKLRALGFALRLHDGGESFWRFCREHACIRNYWGGLEFPRGSARPGSRKAYQIGRARQGLARLHEAIFGSNVARGYAFAPPSPMAADGQGKTTEDSAVAPRGTRVRIAELGEAFPPTLVTAEAYDFGDEVAEAYARFQVSGFRVQATDGRTDLTHLTDPATLENYAVAGRMREVEGNPSVAALRARPGFAQRATPRLALSNPLTVMLMARQAAEILKAPGLAEMAADGVEEGQSVVIFVNFRATLVALRNLLKDLPTIEGDTAMDERAEILRRFGADEIRMVAANLATAGEGLDGLQDLRGEFPRLVLLSPGFNAVQLKQALGRVHRANARSKSVQRIVFASGTVEERACEAVRAKLENMALLNDGDLTAGMETGLKAES